jgi:hypothetical protein
LTKETIRDFDKPKVVFDKPKALFYYFQNSQVVADPFIALALFSPPLASSTKTGSILALEPHCLTKKSSIKNNKAIRAWR